MTQTSLDPLAWVRQHRVPGGGVAVSSAQRVPYPEVTGYLVPSLLQAGADLNHQTGEGMTPVANPATVKFS